MSVLSGIRAPVIDLLKNLRKDPMIGVTATYKKFSGSSFDSTLGYAVSTFDEYSLEGIRLTHSIKSVEAWVGEVQAGDVVFIFLQDELPEGVSLKDQIEYPQDDTGESMNIKSMKPVLDIATFFTVHGD